MVDEQKKAEKAVEKDPEGTAEKSNAQVDTIVKQEVEQGYRGGQPNDPTPNENYTVAGVTAGLPTPETDHKQALEASQSGLTKFNNKGQDA